MRRKGGFGGAWLLRRVEGSLPAGFLPLRRSKNSRAAVAVELARERQRQRDFARAVFFFFAKYNFGFSRGRRGKQRRLAGVEASSRVACCLRCG